MFHGPLAVFFLFFTQLASSYIPTYEMILSHLADSQGRGAYQLDQNVFLKQGAEPVALKETWWIDKNGKMRVDVSSSKKELKKLHLRFIYSRTKKIFKDENGILQTRKISPYHLDRPFHLRNKDKLAKLFSLWKVAPLKAPKRKEGEASDSFIKLSRKGGAIQYEVGKKEARVWLQQDEFVIRSWKWQGERGNLQAWDYKLYPSNLFFPQQRIFRQASGEVLIQVLKVQSLSLKKKLFQKNQLSKKNHLPSYLSSTDQDRIREFYEKFR